MRVEFFKHSIDEVDIENVARALKEIILTTGKTVEDFEIKLAGYLRTKSAVGLMSCTHALQLGLAAYGIGPGDEVITTPMTYVATADAIEYLGAKPVFVDVEETTANINADLIEGAITSKTKAILPVHLYGQMCDMKRIRAIADKYRLKVIEDAAHCLEGERDGIKPGELGDAACFSFYATKSITAGEGGAISTNDSDIAAWYKKARSHGTSKDMIQRFGKSYGHYDKEFLGFKCNMSNIQAAILTHQLDMIEERLRRREEMCGLYNKYFCDKNIKTLQSLAGTKHARHLYTVLVDASKRDEMLQRLSADGIGVAVNYQPVHLMWYYRQKYGYKGGEYPVSENIGASTITLPMYSKLTEEEVALVANTVLKVIK